MITNEYGECISLKEHFLMELEEFIRPIKWKIFGEPKPCLSQEELDALDIDNLGSRKSIFMSTLLSLHKDKENPQ